MYLLPYFFYFLLKQSLTYFCLEEINSMNFFLNQTSSSISIYHNTKFSFIDVESILAPIFKSYYGTEKLRSIISSVDHIWCAYDKKLNKYIACALIQSHSRDNILYIKLFGVEKSSQGQGIGTRLLKAIKVWAKNKGYFAIILHTQINNEKAIGLYEKVGFRKQKLMRNFFRPQAAFSTFNESDAYPMILYL